MELPEKIAKGRNGDLLRIDIDMDRVTIEGTVFPRPAYLARSLWLGDWERRSRRGWISRGQVRHFLNCEAVYPQPGLPLDHPTQQ